MREGSPAPIHRRPSRARRWLVGAAALLALGALAAALAVLIGERPRREAGEGRDEPTASRRGPLALGTGPGAGAELAACDQAPRDVCVEDEVWRTDECGEPASKLEACSEGACMAGSCLPGGSADPFISVCAGVSDLGQCHGEVVRTCLGGEVIEVDCAAEGMRCGWSSEGALCLPRTGDACDQSTTRPRCEGQTLERCVDGRVEAQSCIELGAVCDEAGGHASCRAAALLRGDAEGADCGACDCPPERSDEVCNGEDDDRDGFVDEGVDCSPIDVVAFLLTDGGELAHDRDAVETELRRVNATFASRPREMPSDEGGGPLRFVLADVVELDASRWDGVIDDESFFELAGATQTHPARERFYVPVVFADGFRVGATPRSGAATLPHDTCGGVRRGPGQLPVGLVVVGRRRAPTTLAHELGHFLGLCHTHEADPPVVARLRSNEDGSACEPRCETVGDGLCDTPRDPGPPVCAVDSSCAVACEDGASPDPGNVMGYYPWCRTGFSTEQLREVRRGLARRRAWHECLGFACACDPVGLDCPAGMGCYPFEQVLGSGIDEVVGARPNWRCALDGQVAVGGPCERHRDCGAGTVCASIDGARRCARPCRVGASTCDCLPGADGGELGACASESGGSPEVE